jgi:ABC-2 type transport system permease protein/oleandomycin transport system permease protein
MLDVVRYQISDTLTIAKRNLIRYVRLPRLLFFSSIQPIMFLTLFNYVFGGAIGSGGHVPGGKYINFLLPGIITQVMLFGAVQTGIGLADDMSRGIIDRFRSLPMSRAAVMAGRTVADSARNVVVALIMIVLGSVYGFRFMNGFFGAILMVAILILFGFAFSWVSAFVGLSTGDAETAQLASFLFIFPFTFASAAFLPTATMPHWLRLFADNQPITLVANTARHFALGVPIARGTIWHLFAYIAGLLIVFIPLSVWRYRSRA